MTSLNVGVIGVGNIAKMHLRSYATNPRARIVAVADINTDRSREVAAGFDDVTAYETAGELLADPAVDAVSICTWNDTHAQIAAEALKAGKHVLVEKPLSRILSEVAGLESLVEASGKQLQVGFVRRHSSNAQLLKKFVDAGDLGEIYYAKASFIRRTGNPGGWFADVERSGGGPLIDIGVHIIDLCWYFMGAPKVASVSANSYSVLGNRANVTNLWRYKGSDYDPTANSVEDMINALIRFDNGSSLAVDVSYSLHSVRDALNISVFGERGGAELEPELRLAIESHDTILNIHPQVDSLTFDFDQGFQNEIDHFVAVCLGEAEGIAPVGHGIELMKIIDGIYRSAASRTEITF